MSEQSVTYLLVDAERPHIVCDGQQEEQHNVAALFAVGFDPQHPMSDVPTATRPPTAPTGPSKVWLAHADAVAFLRQLPTASVDLVVTDPPYESLEKHRAVGTTTRLKHSKSSSNDWFTVFPNARFDELFGEVFRVLKKDAHFYLFCDQETAFVAKPRGEQAGFKFWKPLVWDKERIGMGYHYRSRYELILFFEKGKRRLADLGVPDVFRAPRIHRGYPTEKPVSLSSILISQSTSPGAVVVDPFMGTASVGSAALALGRSFLGSDISDKALEIARERLGLLINASREEASDTPPAAFAQTLEEALRSASSTAASSPESQLGLLSGSS